MQALPDVSNLIVDSFKVIGPAWTAAVWPAARALFWILAGIELAMTAAFLWLERHDLQDWLAAFIRSVLVIGFFWTLLVNGSSWMHSIVTSFQAIGQTATGAKLSPEDMLNRGLNISMALLEAGSVKAFLANPSASLALLVAALFTYISFVLIATGYVMLLVEAYAALAAGIIFLGFGGSRWTRPYVERYGALAIAIGLKIMLFYYLVFVGMGLSGQWLALAKTLGTVAAPYGAAMKVMGASMMFLVLVWQIPKFFATLLGGSPGITTGDVIGTAAAVGGALTAATYLTTKAVKKVSTSAMHSLAGNRGAKSIASTPHRVAPPSSNGASGASGYGGSNGGGGALVGRTSGPPSKGSGGGRWKRPIVRIPQDHASPPSPPRMPMDEKD